MAKIPLSIQTSYLPSWGVREGIRELVQNARDAEVQYDAPMTVDYVNGCLRIENEGTVLPHQALLLGHTSKTGRSDTIGKFGEGLKLGVLALVRAGHSVKIRSGGEVWTPSIMWSDVFQADVLTFDINGGRQERSRVRVEIGGISPSQWGEFREGFLFLDKAESKDHIRTPYGTLLLGEKYRGRVYVKGIFVQSLPDLNFGYDLTDAELDRDRKMIESWNLQYMTRSVYLSALSSNSELFTQLDQMLENQAPELQSIDPYNVSYAVTTQVVDYVAQRFIEVHGLDAVPVSNTAEAQEVEHLGVRGVVVNRQQAAILQRKLGDLHVIKSRLANEAVANFTWDDLTEEEKRNLSYATCLLDPILGSLVTQVRLVNFRSQHLLGQCKNNQVTLARKVLSDPDETLRVLIHETAYKHCKDGTKTHLQCVEDIWMQVVRNLCRTSRYDRT